MRFSVLAIALLGLVSAAPAKRQDAAATTPAPPAPTPAPGRHIVAGALDDPAATKCLGVRGGAAAMADGTAVEIRECQPDNPAQHWVIMPGAGQVRVANSTFCLDAGVGPKDGRRMKIWTCYDGLSQQNYFLTGDHRIALTGQGLCLDNTNGSYKNGNRVQVWTCGDGNTNQVWSPRDAAPAA